MNDVIALAAGELVVAVPAVDPIVPGAPDDRVVARETAKDVAIVAADEKIATGRSPQRAVAGAGAERLPRRRSVSTLVVGQLPHTGAIGIHHEDLRDMLGGAFALERDQAAVG